MSQKSYLSKILKDIRAGDEIQDINVPVNWVMAIVIIAILLAGFGTGYLLCQNAGHTLAHNPRAKDLNDGVDLMFLSALGLSLFIPLVFRARLRIFNDGFSIRYLTKETKYSWADIIRPVETAKLRGNIPAVIYYARPPAQKSYSLKYKNGNFISRIFAPTPIRSPKS
jgi:hypothetical protein